MIVGRGCCKMSDTDLSIPCSLAVRYIVCELRTKTINSFRSLLTHNVSQMRTSWIH